MWFHLVWIVAAVLMAPGVDADQNEVTTATITCLAPNGGFSIDGAGFYILNEGETMEIEVGAEGSIVSLWSCGWDTGCVWLSYNLLPGSMWKIVEQDPAPRIVMEPMGLDDLCHPCSEWRNHGEYVSCVAHAVRSLVRMGLISSADGGVLISAAARSEIGKKGFVPPQCLGCEYDVGLACPPSDDPYTWVSGLEVQINGGLSNLDPPCQPVVYVRWDWGDGAVDEFFPEGEYVYPFPNSHQYGAAGTYLTTVTLFDPDGEILAWATCDVTVQE